MKNLDYYLKGFGFENQNDFSQSCFKLLYIKNAELVFLLTSISGTIRYYFEQSIGVDVIVYIAFTFLIIAETQTGIKASIRVKNKRFKSRPFGRMFLKLFTYTTLLFILNSFASRVKLPKVLGFDINPFEWLYFVVFAGIIFQLVISWLENLSVLGYSEAKGLLGIILRKYNKWFEFDGTKNAENE
ncbi:MAG TPA: holin [Flavobacterium sp.]|nr:holin [Flavobacterium sp.]